MKLGLCDLGLIYFILLMIILCFLLYVYNPKTTTVRYMCVSQCYRQVKWSYNLHKVTSLCRTRIYVNIFMTLMPVSTTIWLCTQDSQLPEGSCEEQERERKWSSDQWIPTVMLRNMQEITWFFLRHKVNPLNKDFFFFFNKTINDLIWEVLLSRRKQNTFPSSYLFFFLGRQNSKSII